jgi:CSLREA domain-containing protein/uncharacterized repeat protein (TIGR01451 family)
MSTKARGLTLVIAAVLIALWGLRTRQVHAAPAPPIDLANPVQLQPRYTGADSSVQPVASGQVRVLSLASDDFDGDGIADLAAGYGVSAGGGRVVFYRGSLDAFAPQSQQTTAAFARGDFLPPFQDNAQVVNVPSAPDFLAAGRFMGANGPSLLAASRGGTQIYVVASGDSGLELKQSIDVPGVISALAAYDLHTGGFHEVLVGLHTDAGPQLAIYTGSFQGLAPVATLPLTHDAASFTFGNLDGDTINDALIVAGGEAWMLHGATCALEPVRVSYPVVAAALGSFLFDRASLLQMALLSTDGTLHILAHNEIDSRRLTSTDLGTRHAAAHAKSRPTPQPARYNVPWQEIESFPGAGRLDDAGNSPLLLRSRISDTAGDDLLILGSGNLSLVTHADMNAGSGVLLNRVDLAGDAAAALPIRVNADGRHGIVFLKPGDTAPFIAAPVAHIASAFTVNTTSDGIHAGACAASIPGQCTLREAIIEANSNPGSTINFQSPGTYSLTIGRGVSPDYSGNTNGALYVNSSVTIVGTVDGSGYPTTTINWGTPGSGSKDLLMSINSDISAPAGTTAATVSISNVILDGTGAQNNGVVGADADGGCLAFDTGTGGNSSLTLTNVTIQNCRTTRGNGGGIALFNLGNGSGTVIISNSTIQNNTAAEVTTAETTGGGIWISDRASMTMTNTKVLNNTSSGTAAAPGSGGGITVFSAGANSPQNSIHGSQITGNRASGVGGGIYATANTLVDQGTVISNNTAGTASGSNGGGIYANVESSDTITLTKVTITGNSTSGSGGAIATANALLNMSFSRLAGNSATISGSNLYNDNSTAAVTNNWWGTNAAAGTIATASGTTTFDPFVVLTHTASPATIRINQSTTLTASFLQDNHGTPISSANLGVLSNLPVTFQNAVLGSIPSAQPESISNGTAAATFAAGNSAGIGHADVNVDNATVTANLTILAPPSLTKTFATSPIAVSTSTPVTFSVTNPNSVPIDANFTDNLPTGLQVASSPLVNSNCGGTVTATAGAGSISWTNASLSASTTCSISVNVTGSIDGVMNNSAQIKSTAAGNGNTASASLTVINPPAIAKAFGAPSIALNTATTLTFTLSTANAQLTITGAAFTDTLPFGLAVATPNGLSNTCGGTASAVPGTGSVSLAAASIAPGTTCTVQVTVQGSAAGVKNNSVQVTSTNAGTGNTGTASITVVGPPVLQQQYGASSIPLNGSTSLQFTVTNPNVGTTLTGIGFTDTLPSGLIVSTPTAIGGSCGGGTITATAGSKSISLSGASLGAGISCTFTVNVTGTSAGSQVNTTSTGSSNEGGAGNTATAIINVVAPPSIAMTFGASAIPLNGTTPLTFTITNPSANTVALSGVVFNDTLPAGLTVVNSTSSVCGGTLIISGSNTIGLTGAAVAPAGNCQFSVAVTGAVLAGYTNTTGSVSATNGGTGNTASATLAVTAPPSISNSFGGSAIPLNGTTSLSLNISNPNSSAKLNGLAFTDNLPSGLVVAAPNGLSNSCGGTVTAVAGSGSVVLAGGTVAPSSTCAVRVNVTGTTVGVKNNSAQVSTDGGTGNTANASITVAAPATLGKVFGAASIPLNGSTTLQFTVTNPNVGTTLTGIAFTDTLPSGLIVSTPNGIAGSCGGGTITATAGSNSISLSGASLAAGASCIFSVNVTGVAAGTQNDIAGGATSNEGGTGSAANASMNVVAPPGIAKAFGATGIPLNGTTSLAFTITNPPANAVALTGVAFTDILPAGLTVANSTSTVCGGTLSITGSNTITLTGATVAAGGNCQFGVTVTGVASANYINTTGNVSSTNGGTGSAATANLSVTIAATVVTSAPAGLQVLVDNVPYTAPRTLQWIVGSVHTIGAISSQAGPSGAQFVFRTWSDTGAMSHTVTAPSSPITYTATFGTQYLLTNSVGSGTGTVTPPSGYFDANSVVNLQATPGADFSFVNWSGPVASPTSASTSVTMTGPITVGANFKALPVAQTITFQPIPGHVFGDSPFPIFATASSGLPVTYSILSGPATISGNVLTLTGVGSVTVQASQAGNDANLPAAATWSFPVFPAGVVLTLAANPAAGGSVTATPVGPNYSAGSTAQVTAQANPGFVFIGFSGALGGLDNPQSLQLSQSASVTANFAPISTDPNDHFTFAVTGGGSSGENQSVPFVSATAFVDVKSAVQKSPRVAGPSVLVIPSTGGNWLNAAVDPGPPPAAVLSLNNTVVSQLPTGTYTSYLLLTSATGQQRVLTVTLLVDVVQIAKVLDGAGYRSQPLASEELVTVFGYNQASAPLTALSLPLGPSLGGTSVVVTDGAGVARAAQLVFVSNTQVNLVTPAGMAPGSGSLTVANAAGQKATIPVQIAATAPGLFTAAQNGNGVAAAVVIRVSASGTLTNSLAANCDASGACSPVAVDVSNPAEQVFVSFYGTGIRGVSGLSGVTATIGGVPVEVQYAGAQSLYPGLDQVNVKLNSSLAGKGDATVAISFDGNAANPVNIRIQ